MSRKAVVNLERTEKEENISGLITFQIRVRIFKQLPMER